MVKEHASRQRSIKSKLMAAVSMLLVSTIMMVSSTYAWFTLSTAPEVTGIQTAVGANGNLEMALLPKDGQVESITSAAGDSGLDLVQRNVTWGNLVSLSKDGTNLYGLDKITMYPSALNTDAANANKLNGEFFLKTPQYGADGRVSALVGNALASYYDGENFPASDSSMGVRGIGVSSGMSPRELAYRDAKGAVSTYAAAARNKAANSLNTNGSALAGIAIEYGANGAAAEFDANDIAAMEAMIADLKVAMQNIDTAYMQAILALAASNEGSDEAYLGVKGLVDAEGATLATVLAGLGEFGVEVPADTIGAWIVEYQASVADIAAAENALEALSGETYTWTQIRPVLVALADPTAMTVNGFSTEGLSGKLGELASSVMNQGGINVAMGTGSGVFADIADQCGNYTASVTIPQISYGSSINLTDVKAKMTTNTTVNPTRLSAVSTAVNSAGAPTPTEGAAQPLSDMYGYIIDLAFRTNAANSTLKLQREGIDRIYSDQTKNNEDTQGGGSSMTFSSLDLMNFSNDQVKALMNAIRIIFFDPDSKEIIKRGKLDVANADVTADGVTAEIVLFTTKYEKVTYSADSTDTYYVLDDATNAYKVTSTAKADEDAGKQLYKAVEDTSDDIMELTQNAAHKLSVLVHLDGDLVGNDDVAFNSEVSMTGTMNLQFASSANLVPMEYTNLHQGGSETPAGGSGSGSGNNQSGSGTDTSGDDQTQQQSEPAAEPTTEPTTEG